MPYRELAVCMAAEAQQARRATTGDQRAEPVEAVAAQAGIEVVQVERAVLSQMMRSVMADTAAMIDGNGIEVLGAGMLE